MIQVFDRDTIADQGAQAYIDGIPVMLNPYKGIPHARFGTMKALLWDSGWVRAEKQGLPILTPPDE